MLENWRWSLWRPQTWGPPVAAGPPPPPCGRASAASCGGGADAGVEAADPSGRSVEAAPSRLARARPSRRGGDGSASRRVNGSAGIRWAGSRRRHARWAGRLVLPGQGRRAPGAVEAVPIMLAGQSGERSRVPGGPDTVVAGTPSSEGGRRTAVSSGPAKRLGDPPAGVNRDGGNGARFVTTGDRGSGPGGSLAIGRRPQRLLKYPSMQSRRQRALARHWSRGRMGGDPGGREGVTSGPPHLWPVPRFSAGVGAGPRASAGQRPCGRAVRPSTPLRGRRQCAIEAPPSRPRTRSKPVGLDAGSRPDGGESAWQTAQRGCAVPEQWPRLPTPGVQGWRPRSSASGPLPAAIAPTRSKPIHRQTIVRDPGPGVTSALWSDRFPRADRTGSHPMGGRRTMGGTVLCGPRTCREIAFQIGLQIGSVT